VCALESGSLSETYNIGSGVGLSNMDVINAITPLLESTNCKLSVEHYPERTFDVKSNVLDATKIHQLTGWQPKVQFKDGLLFTLDWLKKNYG
jgi:UDP-glucose 4-epimerase